MPCLRRMLIFYGILLAVVPYSNAQGTQGTQMFEWQFAGQQSVSNSLPSCRTFPLTADARSADGIPPFYMMAFAVGGTPITSFIGTNETNLTWTVTHPVGTQLLLGVVDSQGNSGGIDPPLYTVTDGQTTQCIPATTSEPSFKITANVTDVLDTCQPWGLTIEGGTKPYNITIATLNSGNFTNVTLGANDYVFTYINRMAPGAQIIAAASDLNGRWATGSPFVRTQGSTDSTCYGWDNTSSDQPSEDTSPKAHSISRAKIGIIAGSCIGAVLLCGIVIAAVFYYRRRKHSQRPRVNLTPFFEEWLPRRSQKGDAHLVTGPSISVSAPSISSRPPSTALPSTSQRTSKSGARSTTVMTESHSGASVSAQPVITELPPPYPNYVRDETQNPNLLR